MVKAINLPQDYFHCPELSKRERQYLIEKAQDSAKALVESARSTHGPVRWIEAGSYKGVQMYKGEGRNPDVGEQIQYVCGATTVQATIEEVAAFMDVSTTPKFKAYVPHQHELLDGVVLYTLIAPGAENQHLHQVTVKWSAAHVPSAVIRDRDFLTLECQDVFTDSTGRRGWVRSYHSVKLPCCPDLQGELGFVRGSFYHTGYVFVESERPGWLDCIHTCQVNLKGNLYLPSPIYFLAMKRRIGSVAELGRTLQQRRLGKQTFLSDLELVPKSDRTRCHVCAAKFGMITRKSRCRKCGEVVCHQCTQTWEIRLPKSGVKKVRVCATCAASNKDAARHNSTMDEISLLSSEHPSVEMDDASPMDVRFQDYEDLQKPLPPQFATHHDARASRVSRSRGGSGEGGRSPAGLVPSPHGPTLPISSNGRSGSGSFNSGSVPQPPRRGPAPYDQDLYRPRGFVHQSEYDRPRFESPPPSRSGSEYRGGDPHRRHTDYRDEYGYAPARAPSSSSSGMPPRDPRYRDDYYHYDDRQRQYYTAPPPPARYHHPRAYTSESLQRSGSVAEPHHQRASAPHKFRHAYHTDETVSSSPDSRQSAERSLTAHTLDQHTRQMGQPGPVLQPHPSYEYGRPQAPPRASYHGPSYENGYHPHAPPPPPPPPSQYVRDGVYAQRSPPDDRLPPRGEPWPEHRREFEHREDTVLYRPTGHDDGARTRAVEQRRDADAPPSSSQNARSTTVLPARERRSTPKEAPARPSSTQAPSAGSAASADHEQASTLASKLMVQQQELQEQLQERAQVLSFCSDRGFVIEDTDDEGEEGVDDIQEAWIDSPVKASKMKALQIHDEPDEELEVDPENTAPSSRGSKQPTHEQLSVVQLYQQILELTKKQHAMETNASASAAEKDAVAQELKALYKQLNAVQEATDVAF